ncbi:MAG: hypothetical protein CMN77_14920 [Spirochaetaceae bacterium]|nr:hypothetical protein [Spirochaetaceae bacterium]
MEIAFRPKTPSRKIDTQAANLSICLMSRSGARESIPAPLFQFENIPQQQGKLPGYPELLLPTNVRATGMRQAQATE